MQSDDLLKLPTEDLQKLSKQVSAEITRRKEEEEAASLRRFQEWAAKINTKEIVDLIVPEHGRTSCDDNNRRNGIITVDRERPCPRCIRCALLDFVHDGGYHGYDPVHLNLHELGPR